MNQTIAGDNLLGHQFRIGHSVVTPVGGAAIDDPVEWFRQVVETEIAPLLDEYWFDQTGRAERRKTSCYGAWPVERGTVPSTVGRIPVRNLWLLMLYASRLYQETARKPQVRSGGEPARDPGPGR